ncbi:SGNH/GDSL hydrolase family protein [Lichenifustis flavocetrariae]|uniref:SGNH/GDSL hydrolase family protein n=1 Tax=Lichenifustis flavocetrariae TaxID=2949735 RepID=A0AA42CKX3_9HYPH|nr:SGNH/GDSL hydrolase family protein [Lichenifustis flavocetrariae]MCW6510998.1 SGNH/GDSL hydrolase family protein [Lichenifustis flavocetrariae]
MSGNSFPSVAPPIVSSLPNWFARASKAAESGFNNDTICFWGDSTTATCGGWFGACPLPVTTPTFGSARFVMLHQKTGENLAGTRILNFGNTGAALATALQEPSAAAFNITRLLSASQQIYWPAANPPVAGDTITIGGTVWTWIANGATPSGNQMALGTSFGGSITNLVAALTASTDAQTARNNYASRSSNYDVSYALDIWSKVAGPAGSGQAIACSTTGAQINGTPVLQVPGLIVMCWGINDVRTGTTTQAQLVALLSKAINRVRAVLPATDIVLWGPNSFLTDDPTGAGLVTPSANAQAYTTLLYGAYEQLKNVWPNVLVLQKQDIFGKSCFTYAASGGAGQSWMSDQLHPTPGAQTQMADWLAPLIGFKKPFSPQRANLARLAKPAAPYTIYSREVEDTAFYTTIGQGLWVGQGNVSGQDYLDFYLPGARYKEILPGDVVQMGAGGPVFQFPLTATAYDLNTTTTRLGSLGTGLLPVISGGMVTVFRPNFDWDATVQSYMQQANAYPYRRRFYAAAAGSGYLRLYPLAQNTRDPANLAINAATDVVVVPGIGAITGYQAYQFTGTANWQIALSGTDFTAIKNGYVWVFSPFPSREVMENAFEPMRLNIVGLTSNVTKVLSIAARGAGKVNKVYCTLGTAGTTDLTVTLKVNGTTVVTFTITANHLGLSSTSWAAGASFWIFQGQTIEWDLSGGTGCADLAIVLDVGG